MKNILILSLICFSICCKHKDNSWTPGSGPNNSVYSEVEIYCWCFYDSTSIKNKDGTTSGSGRYCATLAAVRPSELIKSENFFYSTNDKNTIAALQKIILTEMKKQNQFMTALIQDF